MSETPKKQSGSASQKSPGESVPKLSGYEILGKLGAGGMGVVYKARQISMDRLVALKVLGERFTGNEAFTARFLREAKSAGKLNHPNVVQGYDVGEENGVYYFVMELVDGTPLDRVLKERGALPEKDAIEIVIQIARALETAEENNIIHRDIKPENIFISSKGVAKLGDLGLAKSLEVPQNVTLDGQVLGTPLYMSPEQAKGREDIDIRSDIYSLGVSLYHMVTGKLPFMGKTIAITLTKHLQEPMPDPRRIVPEISEGMVRVLECMLAKQVQKRYPSPTALIKDLERLMAGAKALGASVSSSGAVKGELQYKFSRVLCDEEILFIRALLGNKLVSPETLQRCLQEQESNAEFGASVKLGNLMVEGKILSQAQVSKILEAIGKHIREQDRKIFGTKAKEMNLVTEDQLRQAMRQQEEFGKQGRILRLNRLMEQFGFITGEQSRDLQLAADAPRRRQEDRAFGTLVNDLGLCKTGDINKCIRVQREAKDKSANDSLADLLVREGYLNPRLRDALHRARQRASLFEGEISHYVEEKKITKVDKETGQGDAAASVHFDERDLVVQSVDWVSCPFCGSEVPEGAAYCQSCNKVLNK